MVPLIFTAVVSSISNLRQVSNAAKLAWNTLLWFAITSLIAVLIGIGLGVLLQPGANTGITQEAKYAGKSGDWWAFLIGLFPKNFLGLGASSTVTESATRRRHHRRQLQRAPDPGHRHRRRRRRPQGGQGR